MGFFTSTLNRSNFLFFFLGKVMGDFWTLSGNFNFSSVHLAQIRWKSDFFMCLTNSKDFVQVRPEGLSQKLDKLFPFYSTVVFFFFVYDIAARCLAMGFPLPGFWDLVYEVRMSAWRPTFNLEGISLCLAPRSKPVRRGWQPSAWLIVPQIVANIS